MGLSFRDSKIRLRKRRTQSGQGTVEYILILVVTVSLILGVTYQFNDAFRSWAKNYFGDYLACLLETGELPAISGTGGSTTACSDIFKPFSLAEGRPFSGDGSDGDGSDGDGSGGEDDPANNSDESDNATNSSGGAAGASSQSRSGGEFGESGRFGRGRRGAGAAAQPRKPKKVYTGSTEDSLSGALASGGAGPAARRRQQFIDSGYFVSREQRAEEKRERVLAKVGETTKPERRDRILVKRKLASTSVEEPSAEMTFGDYFRYLLIAAIIIALVIVLGGQLSQISKEME